MTYIPDDEYRRIRTSWDVAPRGEKQWTNDQMATACHANIQEAAKRESNLQKMHDSCRPGDIRLVGTKDTPPLRLQILTATHDQAHWRQQLEYWRAQCVKDGPDALPPLRYDVRRQPQEAVPAVEAQRSTVERRHWSEAQPVRGTDPIWEAELKTREAREPGADEEELAF